MSGSPARTTPRTDAVLAIPAGAIPLLEAVDIHGTTITADALLTRCDLATHLVKQRHVHYHFTVKGNQKTLLQETTLHFDQHTCLPDHSTSDGPDHGRIETRHICVTSTLNDFLNFPNVGQTFKIERLTHHKKGATKASRSPMASPAKRPSWPALNRSCATIGNTGVIEMLPLSISSIGTITTRIVAVSEQDMAREA